MHVEILLCIYVFDTYNYNVNVKYMKEYNFLVIAIFSHCFVAR